MTTDPAATRDQRIASLKIIDEYYWMLLRHLTIHTRARLGEPGMKALGEGFRLAGRYRGQSMAEDPATLASGNDALSLLRAWDVADLAFAHPDSVVEVEGGPAAATVMLPSVPGSDYFAKRGGAEILASYWSNTLQGIAEGFDEEMSVSHTEISADGSGPYGDHVFVCWETRPVRRGRCPGTGWPTLRHQSCFRAGPSGCSGRWACTWPGRWRRILTLLLRS